MTKITINGVEVDADPSKPLIHACHTHAVDVPMYCYHPGLSPVGSCRICQVEVRQGDMPPRVMVACRTPVAEGMVVDTEAAGAHAARRECLEFLLKNHPLDCPICDKAGECDLQDFAFQEGQNESRTVEPRRKLEKRKSLGEVIVLDEERCILCSRCVRFMEEVPKTPQLTVSGLGSRSTISTFADRPLSGNYQGNLADVCPVGALTLKAFRFQARVWNLRTALSTCSECSRGCSTTVEVLRDGAVKRIRPRENEDVNGWWICDHGRFAFGRYSDPNDPGRVLGALERGYQGFEPADADDAVAAAADLLEVHGESAALLISPFATVEEATAAKTLLDRLPDGTRAAFVSPPPNDLADDVLHTGDPCPNRRGLTDLGFEGLAAADALALAAEAQVVLFIGERIVELALGEDPHAALDGLARGARVVLFDTHAVDHPSVKLAYGVPYAVEKSGTFVNVDGKRGRLTIARPAPSGVRPLDKLLSSLAALIAPLGVAGSESDEEAGETAEVSV